MTDESIRIKQLEELIRIQIQINIKLALIVERIEHNLDNIQKSIEAIEKWNMMV